MGYEDPDPDLTLGKATQYSGGRTFRIGSGGGPGTLGKLRPQVVMEERPPKLPWEENGLVA